MKLLMHANWVGLILLTALVGSLGCSSKTSTPEFVAEKLPTEDALQTQLRQVLTQAKQTRHLSAQNDSAWQMVHGILAYGREYQVDLDGTLVPALEWILNGAELPGGGQLEGWRLVPASHGVRAIMQPGTMTGQGHPDQWIGYLSQAGLRLEEPLKVGQRMFKVQDLLTQAQFDIQPDTEATWTLMAFMTYLPLDASWTSSDGTQWTLEKLVAREAEDTITGASCGGCHRLYALSIAVNRYMDEHGITEDQLPAGSGWQKANDRVLEHIDLARKYQQPDGTFSTSYFNRPGTSPELEKQISVTGHVLEVLTVSLTDEQLQAPWVTAAVSRLAHLLDATSDAALNAGALYHATHSLKIYYDRRFGPFEAEAVN